MTVGDLARAVERAQRDLDRARGSVVEEHARAALVAAEARYLALEHARPEGTPREEA